MDDIRNDEFQILLSHEVLLETYDLNAGLNVTSEVVGDHHPNYIHVARTLLRDREHILQEIKNALGRDENSFRDISIGTELLNTIFLLNLNK